jgi:hypothetical protein
MGRRLGAFRKRSTKLCKTTFLSASCCSEKRSLSRCKKSSRNTPRSRTCSSAGIRNEFLPLIPLSTHRTRFWTSTSLSLQNMKFKIYTFRQHPPTLTMDSGTMSGKHNPLFSKMYVRRANGGDYSNKSICCCIILQRFNAQPHAE